MTFLADEPSFSCVQYTVLESSTDSVFLHVTTSSKQGAEFGSIFKVSLCHLLLVEPRTDQPPCPFAVQFQRNRESSLVAGRQRSDD